MEHYHLLPTPKILSPIFLSFYFYKKDWNLKWITETTGIIDKYVSMYT